MKKLGNKGASLGQFFGMLVFFLGIFAVVGIVGWGIATVFNVDIPYLTVGGDGITTIETEEGEGILLIEGAKDVSKSYFEFEGRAKVGGTTAQDTENDVEIDVFETDNDCLAELYSHGYVNCIGVVPAMNLQGSSMIELATYPFAMKNFGLPTAAVGWCKVNEYYAWQTASAADIEARFDDYCTIKEEDMDVKKSTAGATESVLVTTGKTYLVVVTENADTDEQDVIPHAFLITANPKTTLDPSDLEAGTTKITVDWKYYSDAFADASSAVDIDAEMTSDSENKLPSLTISSSNISGVIDSSLTTAVSNFDFAADIEVCVDEDGYALLLVNGMPNAGNTEQGALVVDVYGISNESIGNWTEVSSTTARYTSSTPTDSTYDYIIWASSEACGIELTSDSESSALVYAGEKLRPAQATCLRNLYDDECLIIPVKVQDIGSVDYDAATIQNDTILQAESGTSPEGIFDLNLYGMESTTNDAIARGLTA